MPLHDRRSFLATLGASLGATALAASGLDAVPLACAPTDPPAGAGRRLEPIGVQLYTLRGEMRKDVGATLARVARIGYTEVEFAGYFGKTPKELRALLDAHGLRAPSAHLQGEALGAGWDAALEAARVIGHEYLVVAWIDAAKRRTLGDVRRVAELFDRAGAAAQQAGLRFAYHNHDFEFIPIEGRLPYDVLLEETDPALVAMEMDLYWAVKGGQDPVAYFAKHPGRFPMVHVKDSAGAPAHQMADVGRGTIDFPRIFAHRAQAGARHFFVEHDEPADPWASIESSYAYLSRLKV